MIQPLYIANKQFAHNIIQGPLAGVSCAPFRYLASKYGKPAFSYTEMISCKTLLNAHQEKQTRFITKDPKEGPVCFQLSSNNPKELAEATKIATDLGADFIDLNCGCPVKKIRGKGAGSRLLTNPTLLYQLIQAMKQNTHQPISIKIRVESIHEKFHHELVKVISEAGVDFLVVHGRNWAENYTTPCRYDDIQFFVEHLKIPVIGNGDIHDMKSLNKMLATGCRGVMISRATVGQPWLIQKLISEFNRQDFKHPSPIEINSIFIEHVTQLAKLLNNEKLALLQCRKFVKYYARRFKNWMKFCSDVNVCDSMMELRDICDLFFTNQILNTRIPPQTHPVLGAQFEKPIPPHIV